MSGGVTGTGRGSFCFLRVRRSQNDCFIKVKLSVFRVYWVSVIALSHPQVNNQFRASLRDMKILRMFSLSVKKSFMTDVDPSIVRQHAWPLKNNFKPCTLRDLFT